MTTGTTAERLGRFVAGTRYDDLPADIVAKAKRHILDTFGAALAGTMSEEARRALTALTAGEASGASPVWGTAVKVSPRNAALLNGIAAHAFELDDTGGCDHSGAVVLPAAVAALDLAGQSMSGRRFLTAVVLGYDLGRRALEGLGGYKPHNAAGWHSTGTCGTFGAAAAASHILGLDERRSTSAITLAASFSCGLWAFIHDGAMAKRVHAGRAAEGGLLAALLAAQGVTGPTQVFDGGWGGFFTTFAPLDADPDALTQDLGTQWRIGRAAIKPYASCRDTHAAVDAVGRVLERRKLQPNEIAAVHVRANSFLAAMVGGRTVDTLPAAQMSLPYAVAARLVFGAVGLSSYADIQRNDPTVRAMLERIFVDVDETVVGSDRSSVTIVLADGSRIEEPTTIALGAPENPLSDAAVKAKFAELAATVLNAAAVRSLCEAVLALDALSDARRIIELLSTA